MVDYIRSHYKRATLFVIAALGAAGLSVGSFVTMKALESGQEEEAATRVAEARAALDSGDVVFTGLALIEIIDTYPNTQAKFEAYRLLEELRSRLSAGELPVEVLLEFEAKLPGVHDLKTAAAKHIIHLFYLNKANLLGKLGMTEFAQGVLESAGESVLETLDAHPDSPWHIGISPVVFENAARHLPEYAASYAEALETFIAETEPCMATFSARYALLRHYLHEGMDRQAAERHMAVILDASSSRFITEAVTDPYLYDSEKGCFLWAKGYAAFEMGQIEEALGIFQTMSAELPESGRERDWANITIPAAYKRLYPDDPAIAEAAYQDYLAVYEDHEYAQWALLELGNIAMETERFDEAKSYFTQVEAEFPKSNAARMAVSGIDKSNELKALKSGAGPD